MSEPCVLDASAALSLLVAGQLTHAARSFFQEPSHEWCAPRLWQLEVRNAVHRLERRGTIAIAAVDERLALLESEVRFEESRDVTTLRSIVERAREQSLSIYDACYLDMAVRENAAIATRDTRLLDASRSSGVRVFDLR